MVDFVWPLAFLLVLLFPLARILLPAYNRNLQALRVPNLEVFEFDASRSLSSKKNIAKIFLLFLAWIAIVTALARPQWTGEPMQLETEGRDFFLVVDISGSMEGQDMVVAGNSVSRLDAVKHVVASFISDRHGDRIGLIVFGSTAHVYVPLSYDVSTILKLLQSIPARIAGQQTAIGDALGIAVKRLADRPKDHRVVILLTDGVHNHGELTPEEATELANQTDVRVYTIGVGGSGTSSLSGVFSMLRQTSNIDEESLDRIASTTGGKFFRGDDTDGLQRVFDEIADLEPIEQSSISIRPVKSLAYIPLGIALVLFLLLWFLRH